MSLKSNVEALMPPILVDPDCEFYQDEPVFDPDIHLALTEPEFVVLLDGFQHVPKAPRLEKPTSTTGASQIAYSGPFRVLSDEGYRVLKKILEYEMNYRISDSRHPAKIRFGGYRSKWIQDFNRCPKILEHLSKITGDVELLPTTLQSSYNHTNIGYAGSGTVDCYHLDSVPYVLILLACDMSQTVGGELQLIERQSDEALRLIEQYQAELPNELVRTIDYLGTNSCVFMQGSKIVHRVKGIQSCVEPRITVVNSYMSTNPWANEVTRYDTFRKEKYGAVEFAMHKTWRAKVKMFELASGKHPWPTVDQIVDRLHSAIDELNACCDILTEKKSDRVGYYDEKKKAMAFMEKAPTTFQPS